MLKSFVVGIDAGGTSVRVQFAESATRQLWGEPFLIGANPTGEPPMNLVLPLTPVVSVCAGITKYTRSGIVPAWGTFLQERFPGARIAVVPDYVIAFHAAIPEGSGVVIVAGTGSVAYGENRQTEATARCGGRGWEWGDEGSGAWLSTEMIRRTLRALDGQAEETVLTKAVCEEFGTVEPATLAGEARRRATEEKGEGRGFLLPLLVHLQKEGDAESSQLFVGAGGWLASLADATARQLGFARKDAVTFSTAGGVWRAGGETLQQAFGNALRRRYPKGIVRTDTAAPTVGAVHLASLSQQNGSELTTRSV